MSDEQSKADRVKKRFDLSKNGYTSEERRNLRRSRVRVLVTYAAAFYLFVLGPIAAWMIFDSAVANAATGTEGAQSIAILQPNVAAGKDLFLSILPIATGIVTYWFAARSQPSNTSGNS